MAGDLIRIQRWQEGSELLVANATRLAEAFFRLDASSNKPDSYDGWIASGFSPPNRIVRKDVEAMNRTMRARSGHKWWVTSTESPKDLPWLKAIDPQWDLVGMAANKWQADGCEQHVERAVGRTRGPGRNLSVATKVLHIKRPRLFPVLDSRVVRQLQAPARAQPIDVIMHIREQGRRNLLELKRIQNYLRRKEIDRSLVRIMDALLWSADPASWLSPIGAMLEEWREEDVRSAAQL